MQIMSIRKSFSYNTMEFEDRQAKHKGDEIIKKPLFIKSTVVKPVCSVAIPCMRILPVADAWWFYPLYRKLPAVSPLYPRVQTPMETELKTESL
jgi:hypothetical protein